MCTERRVSLSTPPSGHPGLISFSLFRVHAVCTPTIIRESELQLLLLLLLLLFSRAKRVERSLPRAVSLALVR